VKSPWGTGKSFFVDNWQKSLKHAGLFTVYFSAWQAEIQQQPAFYFLQTFIKSFKDNPEYFCRLDELLENGTLRILPIILTLATIVAIPANAVAAFFLKLLTDKVKEKCEKELKKFDLLAESPMYIEESKENLKIYLNQIFEVSSDERIYVFIDELDRCKPDFAIKVLEEIKHFFSLPNVVFVLSVDLQQLEGTIKHIYGQHIDCEGYLMRFVNLFYTLPPSDNLSYAKYLRKRLPDTLPDALHSLPPEGELAKSSLKFEDIFAKFSDAFGSSLRDQERIITKLNLMLPEKIFLLPTLYFLFVQLHFPAYWQKNHSEDLNKLRLAHLNAYLKNIKRDTINLFIQEADRQRHPYNYDVTMIDYNQFFLSLLDGLISILSFAQNQKLQTEENNSFDKSERNRNVYYWYFRDIVLTNLKDFNRQLEIINLYSENIGYSIGSVGAIIGQGTIQPAK
jgi:hypothetical protein